MLSIVFCGGMIPVTGRLVLEQVSWAIPARWGFAATASTTDLRTIAPLLRTNETLWSHQVGWWLLDMTVLILVGAVLAGCVRWRIRLNAAAQILDHTGWYRWCMRLGPVVAVHAVRAPLLIGPLLVAAIKMPTVSVQTIETEANEGARA